MLEAKPAEERAEFVQQIANEYQQTPTKLRSEFARRVQSTPEKSPEEIRRELDARENRAMVVTFRADAALHQAIDSYAATQKNSRAEAVAKLVRLGLQTADEITRPLNRLMSASFDGSASDNITD